MCRSIIDSITSWIATNRLLFNSSKVQAIWLGGGGPQLAKIDPPRLFSRCWLLLLSARRDPLGTLSRLFCVRLLFLLGRGAAQVYIHHRQLNMRDMLHWLTICQRIQYRIPARDSRCVLQRQRVSLYRYVSFAASMSVILLRGVSYYHSFSYYANKNKNGIFGYWSISKDWTPLWAAFLVDSQLLQILPFYISLHFTSFYFCRWLWAGS